MDCSEAGSWMVGEANGRLQPANDGKNACEVDCRTVAERYALVKRGLHNPKEANAEKAKRVTWLCTALIILGNGFIVAGIILETCVAESTPEAARIALFIIGGIFCLPPSYYLLYSRPCNRQEIGAY